MNRPLNKILFLAVITFSSATSASALDLSGVLGSGYSQMRTSPTLSGERGGVPWLIGGLVGWDWIPFISMETGLLYSSYPYSPSAATDLTYNYFKIPFVLRFNPFSLLSLGAGGYFGLGTGTSISGAPSTAVVSGSQSDYGLWGTIGIRIPLAPFSRIRLDAIYEYGLANLSRGTSSASSSNIIILAGLMIII